MVNAYLLSDSNLPNYYGGIGFDVSGGFDTQGAMDVDISAPGTGTGVNLGYDTQGGVDTRGGYDVASTPYTRPTVIAVARPRRNRNLLEVQRLRDAGYTNDSVRSAPCRTRKYRQAVRQPDRVGHEQDQLGATS